MRHTRKAHFGVTSTLALVLVTGCGALPPEPPEVPDTYVPNMTFIPESEGGITTYGFSEAQRMTVRVRNVGCSAVTRGTGFAIDQQTLVTNKHVVEGTNELQLSTSDGRDIEVTGAQSANLADLAIVRTTQQLDASPVLASADPQIGDVVSIIGYPNGGQLTLTSGTVLDYTDDPLNENLGQVAVADAEVEPGSSGSAVLNESGQVVGVVYAKSSSGKTFFIPVSTLTTLLDTPADFTQAEEPTCD